MSKRIWSDGKDREKKKGPIRILRKASAWEIKVQALTHHLPTPQMRL